LSANRKIVNVRTWFVRVLVTLAFLPGLVVGFLWVWQYFDTICLYGTIGDRLVLVWVSNSLGAGPLDRCLQDLCVQIYRPCPSKVPFALARGEDAWHIGIEGRASDKITSWKDPLGLGIEVSQCSEASIIVSAQDHRPVLDDRKWRRGNVIRVRTSDWDGRVPTWLVFALTALPSSIPLTILTRRSWRAWKRRQKLREGLCLVCGYDLRATPDRCPECGTVPTKPKAPTPTSPAV